MCNLNRHCEPSIYKISSLILFIFVFPLPFLFIRRPASSGNFCPAERDLERSMRYCIYMSEKMLRESEEKAAADPSSSWASLFISIRRAPSYKRRLPPFDSVVNEKNRKEAKSTRSYGFIPGGTTGRIFLLTCALLMTSSQSQDGKFVLVYGKTKSNAHIIFIYLYFLFQFSTYRLDNTISILRIHQSPSSVRVVVSKIAKTLACQRTWTKRY